MSIYHVQKFIQNVNRNPDVRQRFFEERAALISDYQLTAPEQTALLELNIFNLYEMGVHPLLLRPFTIINGVSEPDYLKAIREGS